MDLLTAKPPRSAFDSGARRMVSSEVRRPPPRGFRGGKPRPVKEFARKKEEIAGDSIRFLPEAGEILLIQPDSVDRGKRKAS